MLTTLTNSAALNLLHKDAHCSSDCLRLEKVANELMLEHYCTDLRLGRGVIVGRQDGKVQAFGFCNCSGFFICTLCYGALRWY